MLRYASIIDEETGLCAVGIGSDTQSYREMGMEPLDVEQSDVDNNWYLADKCPHQTDTQKLNAAKQEKLGVLSSALSTKQSDPESALTFNLPAQLKKGDEVIQVDAFELLTVTSAGALSEVLMGYAFLAARLDIQDIIVTADGYTIVGLNEKDASGVKFIDKIFMQYSVIAASITEYFRRTKEAIIAASSMEDLEAITIDFDQF